MLKLNITFPPDVEAFHELDTADINWVYHLGPFKTASRMVRALSNKLKQYRLHLFVCPCRLAHSAMLCNA